MCMRNQQGPWFAILARTNREKNATLLLENAGYECYLPLIKITRQWSGRVKEVEMPLFPEFLFCRMNPNNRLPILMSPGVIQIVGVGNTPMPVEEEEISAIQHSERSGVSVIPWPYMQVGHVAHIENGPLRGLSGIVLRIKSRLKLILSVSLLRRSVAVEIDRSWISAEYPGGSNANQPAPDPLAPFPYTPVRLGTVGGFPTKRLDVNRIASNTEVRRQSIPFTPEFN
jgi:transcription antitermination factor NusG